MNTTIEWLRSLLEWWYPSPENASGEGTVWSLRHAWPLAPWQTLLLGVAVVALVVIAHQREGAGVRRLARVGLVTLRLLVIGIVLFMLAQFILPRERTGLPHVVVLVDDSASMGIADHYDESELKSTIAELLRAAQLSDQRRLTLAKGVLLADNATLLHTIQNRYKLKLYYLSDAARVQSGDVSTLSDNLRQLEPLGENSRLGLGIRSVLNDLRGAPPAAIILLSDGITTDGETLADATTLARRKGVPLFTVAIGSRTPLRDLELSDLLVDEVVFVDDLINFEAKLTGAGYEGRSVNVTLKDKGSGETLARRAFTVGADNKPQKISVPYRPSKVGDFEYLLEVEADAQEVQADNNTQGRSVSVRKEQIRTLLVQSYPNYEFRYLKHMLQRDSTISLRTVLQEADGDYTSTDATALPVFPVRREELFEYDVILFGDVDPSFLSASMLQNLAAFVTQKGGGVVFLAGPLFNPLGYRDTPLATLLPIDFAGVGGVAHADTAQGYQVRPTELGQALPAFQLGDSPQESLTIWGKLPPLYWLFETPQLKPAARVLAERQAVDGRALPIISMQYVGAGKTIFHATDDTWRWRFRIGDAYFARYWVQTIRYLARGKLLGKDRTAELSADRREYRRGESVRLRLRFIDDRVAPAEDDAVVVTVEQEGQPHRRVTLRRQNGNRGIFEGLLSRPLEGRYHAWVSAPTLEGAAAADFRVVAPPGEFERVQTEIVEMQRAAELTKGHFYTLANVQQLVNDLPRGHQVPIESLEPIVLWNQPLVLAIFLALLIGEWILRKLVGLL